MAKVKKSVAKKIPKAANSKKSSKSTQLDAKLHQTFLTSLASLETFWAKKSSALKKEIEILRSKSDKISLKQKANKKSEGKKSAIKAQQLQTTSIQEALVQAKEALSQAKSNSSKYTSLSKLISQFERDWKKKSTESAVKVVAKKVKEAPKATKLDGRKTPKSKPAKTKEAIAEPLMPNKKRGRPKAAEPTAPLVAEEVLVEPIQDEIEMEEDSYEDMNEVFTALDEPLDDVLAEFEMAEESDDFLEDESFED